MNIASDDREAEREATSNFERLVGVTNVPVKRVVTGNRQFLKFLVGREAPIYTYALHEAQRQLSSENPFRGALGIQIAKGPTFPNSLEASALLTLLARSTREVSADTSHRGYAVPFIPFHKLEDHKLAQPATQIVRGRRGVGKSTLIRRAVELLRSSPAVVVVLDMQTYSTLDGDDLVREVLQDLCTQVVRACEQNNIQGSASHCSKLGEIAERLASGDLSPSQSPPSIKRALGAITQATSNHAFFFLDDFHVVDHDSQPALLHVLHATVKGANGWLKIAGLSSLLNTYSAKTRKGLQVPGDAQFISLDLTLENPEAAESHLRAILESFLKAVGYSLGKTVIPTQAFRRLAWATAGVPRDFLQMFARSIEHAQRNRHTSVTLSDVNIAIGEFGQQKMEDVARDARNEADALKDFLRRIEALCLDENKVNAFLVRSDDSKERTLVRALSDLRMVHLIHQSITPHRAGEHYEAYIIDYSIFTGFRRRREVHEMLPDEAQFKASDLRALPRIETGFLQNL
jgi:hypothetical protein